VALAVDAYSVGQVAALVVVAGIATFALRAGSRRRGLRSVVLIVLGVVLVCAVLLRLLAPAG